MDDAAPREPQDVRGAIAKARKRSWEAIAVAFIALLYAVGHQLFGACAPTGTLRCERLQLAPPEAAPQGFWQATDDGAWFLMTNAAGNRGLQFSVGDNGGTHIALFTNGGAVPVNLSMAPDGQALLSFHAATRDHTLATGLGDDGEPFVAFFDDDGNARFSARMGVDGSATIEICDESGRVIWRAP